MPRSGESLVLTWLRLRVVTNRSPLVYYLVTTEEVILAFIRKKRVNGKEYAQVVENYREDGKVRQRVLLHLGIYSPAEALSYWTGFGNNHKNSDWKRWASKAKNLRSLVEQGKITVTEEDKRQVEAKRQESLEALRKLIGEPRGGGCARQVREALRPVHRPGKPAQWIKEEHLA